MNEIAPTPPKKRRNNTYFGIVIILIGLAWLLKRTGSDLVPHWLLTWPSLVIVLGIGHAVKHGFRDAFSYIVILVGGFFLARNYFNIPTDLEIYLWPALVIAIGLLILFKPRRKHQHCEPHQWQNWRQKTNQAANTDNPNEDSIDTIAVMSGVEKDITSQDFKGGQITAVMGGCELDLSQAEIQGTATLDVTVVLGGVTMAVPTHWEVRLNTTNIAGGVEDKRRKTTVGDGARPVLIISGTVVLGGFEIKSY